MLELILAAFIPFLPASVEGQLSSGYEVVELFHADTPDELEAALTDGYPMPWLEEILNDESIPEEDRYWLDCRVRAVIAQDLHLFFDRDGNPVNIDADWIKYCDYYWQENFIVNPPGEYPLYSAEPNPETGLCGESGYIYNRYGEKTGKLALCDESIRMSRDGSIGLLYHHHTDYSRNREYNPLYISIMYNDGSYATYPETYSDYWAARTTLSSDGESILFEDDKMSLMNEYLNLLWERDPIEHSMGTGIVPVILSDQRRILVPSVTLDPWIMSVHELNIDNGEQVNLYQSDRIGRIYHSQDGNLFFCGDECISLNSGNAIWTIPEYFAILSDNSDSNRYFIASIQPSEDGKYYCFTYWDLDQGSSESPVLYLRLYDKNSICHFEYRSDDPEHELLISPENSFVLIGQSDRHRWISSFPYGIWKIEGDLDE